MTYIKAMHGNIPIDLCLVDTEDMDKMLASPAGRVVGTPVYIDQHDRLFPKPMLPMEFILPTIEKPDAGD